MGWWAADTLSWHQVSQDLSGKGRGNAQSRGVFSSLTPPSPWLYPVYRRSINRTRRHGTGRTDSHWPRVTCSPTTTTPETLQQEKAAGFLPHPPVPADPSSKSFPWQRYHTAASPQHRYLLLTPLLPLKPHSRLNPRAAAPKPKLHHSCCTPPSAALGAQQTGQRSFSRNPSRSLPFAPPSVSRGASASG